MSFQPRVDPPEGPDQHYFGAGVILGYNSPCGWEVLLAQRGEHPYLGYWSVPGGGKNPTDRSSLVTALREASEELFQGQDILGQLEGWLANDFEPSRMPLQRHSTPRGNSWRTYFLELAGKPPIDSFAILQQEVTQIAWYHVEALPTLIHPCVMSSLKHFSLINGPIRHRA
jgi:8-oxo-dGTP pyrophosphatase MutT (NUDIX family)